MVIIGFTGHTNIEKANGIEIKDNGRIYNNEIYEKVLNEIKASINELKKVKNIKDIGIVSGMARGVDEIAAYYAIINNLPLILSIPNSIKWHRNRPFSRGVKAQAIKYDEIIKYVLNRINNGCKYSKINEISSNYLGIQYKYANEARNQNIIDASTYVISYLKYPSTGTLDGIKKAKEKNKYFINITDLKF